ncbi:hypothetical protein [Zunongwangia sp.]|uniref:hypothetical protein n=1 Tax=Zunongwangia sp. TaxID=1965325 RepID=UPI003AA7C8C5
MKIQKLNCFICLLLLGSVLSAQEKIRRDYSVNKDVVIDLTTTNTNVFIENWDKPTVAIVGYVDSDLSKSESNTMLDNWEVSTTGTKNKVTIRSKSKREEGWNNTVTIHDAELEDALSQIPEIMGPIMNDLVNPLLQSFSEHPMPPEVYNNISNLNFDYEAYREEGDAYLERWEKEVDKKFDKDFERKIEKWAKEIEKSSEKDQKKLEKSMEAWGESFGKSIEAWGESFGKNMEAWGESFSKKMEAKYGKSKNNRSFISNSATDKVKKTIRIKVPKTATLKMNIRYGQITTHTLTNVDANISHAAFKASRVKGENSHIKASYSPISVKNWEYGVLNAAYLPVCDIANAESIKLISNSSDITIENLQKVGILSGTFGNLIIENLSSDFKNLDINLENSDLRLHLPKNAFTINYNGTKSEINYPSFLLMEETNSYDNKLLKGYSKTPKSNSQLNITARYSDVLLN